MDVLGVNQMAGNMGKNRRRKAQKSAADFRVVYISSPMKVKATASEFRALVQKLTGQDSDAERFMELINEAATANPHDSHQTAAIDHDHLHDSSKSSTLPMDPPDDAFFNSFDGSFTGMFQDIFLESALL